tara:strand:- start:403 stop:636 length:234 start_codon:yes stop_codon:yes gene_type:complete
LYSAVERGQNPPPNAREKDDRTLFRSLPLLQKKSRDTYFSPIEILRIIAAGKKVNVTTEFCAVIATCIRKQRKMLLG